MSFFKEEINIVKDGKDFLIQRKIGNKVKYLVVYNVNKYYWHEEKRLAIKSSSLEDIENHYIGYINDLETFYIQPVKKLNELTMSLTTSLILIALTVAAFVVLMLCIALN